MHFLDIHSCEQGDVHVMPGKLPVLPLCLSAPRECAAATGHHSPLWLLFEADLASRAAGGYYSITPVPPGLWLEEQCTPAIFQVGWRTSRCWAHGDRGVRVARTRDRVPRPPADMQLVYVQHHGAAVLQSSLVVSLCLVKTVRLLEELQSIRQCLLMRHLSSRSLPIYLISINKVNLLLQLSFIFKCAIHYRNGILHF